MIVLSMALLATEQVSAPKAARAGLLSALLLAIFVFVPREQPLSYCGRITRWWPSMIAAAADGAGPRSSPERGRKQYGHVPHLSCLQRRRDSTRFNALA
jgi:hypothetical protein